MGFLLILIFISYFSTGFQFFDVFGYGITALDFSYVIFFIYIFKKLLWDGEELKFSWHSGLTFVLLLLLSVLISGFSPIFEGRGEWIIQFFKSSIHFLYIVLFTFICATYKFDIKIWLNVVKTLLILSLFINIFGVYQILARAYDLPLAWIDITNVSLQGREKVKVDEIQQLSLRYGDFYRATSIFSEPSALGGFNALILGLLFAPIIQKRRHFFKSKIFIWTLISAAIIGSFFSFSMTGFVGLSLQFISIVLLGNKKNIPKYAVFLVIFSSFIFLTDSIFKENIGISVAELFKRRIEGMSSYGSGKEVPGESLGERMKTGNYAIEIWKEYPLTGIGLGLTEYNKKFKFGYSDFSVTAAMAELGTFGVFSFIGMFIVLFYHSRYLSSTKSNLSFLTPDERLLAGTLFYIMVQQFLINFISGNNLIGMNLWIPISIVFATLNIVFQKSGKPIYIVKLVKEPLKLVFNRNITVYISQYKSVNG